MIQRIRRIAPLQTAKVLGVVYGILGLVIGLVFAVVALIAPRGPGIGVGFAILIPIIYGVAGAIVVAIGCALYNLVAQWTGGIEVELSDQGSSVA